MNKPLLTQLIKVRQEGRVIETLPLEARPSSLDEAYGTADALAEWIALPVVGWKIGASMARGQQALGLNEPFGGRVFAGRVYESGAAVRPFLPTFTIGAEFTCRLSRDLQPGETFDAETITHVIDAIYPSLELNQVSYADPMGVGGLCIIADNGFSAGLVLGKEIEDWRLGDWEIAHQYAIRNTQYAKLMQTAVTFSLNGAVQGRGCAADIQFNPLAALAWLANDRAKRGDPLRAGQLVATGDLVGAIEAGRGSGVVADFGELGKVELVIE
jgi:2-keto-4-pentenoate hydratase